MFHFFSSQVSSLLMKHPDLQGEVQEIFQQLHSCSKTTDMYSAAQTPNNQSGESIIAPGGSYAEEERKKQAVCAKNITVTSNGEKVVVWTRWEQTNVFRLIWCENFPTSGYFCHLCTFNVSISIYITDSSFYIFYMMEQHKLALF